MQCYLNQHGFCKLPGISLEMSICDVSIFGKCIPCGVLVQDTLQEKTSEGILLSTMFSLIEACPDRTQRHPKCVDGAVEDAGTDDAAVGKA